MNQNVKGLITNIDSSRLQKNPTTINYNQQQKK